MPKYRIQVHVVLRSPEAGTSSVMAYEIEAETHGRATIEGRTRALADPMVWRATMVTWALAGGTKA